MRYYMRYIYKVRQKRTLFFYGRSRIFAPFLPYLSRWAEINAPQTISEEKLSFPPHAFAGVNSDGNPKPIGRERKVQLIMFTYLYQIKKILLQFQDLFGRKHCAPTGNKFML